MIKPKRHPREFGFKQGDTHVVLNAETNEAKAFSFEGKPLWVKPALMNGQHWNWAEYQGDTPPGLYKLGQVWDDYITYGNNPPYSPTILSYGWVAIDMIDLEGNEDNNGRSGICIHGGGTGLGFPGCWEAYQPLLPTWGCVRMHNTDVRGLLPFMDKGTIYVSVYQD
ncbi:MAG: L,D-transpeptidase [Planktothrix sp.]